MLFTKAKNKKTKSFLVSVIKLIFLKQNLEMLPWQVYLKY